MGWEENQEGAEEEDVEVVNQCVLVTLSLLLATYIQLSLISLLDH